MRLAVLASPDSWYVGDLRRAAGTRHELCEVPFGRLAARLGRGEVRDVRSADLRLDDFDALLVRTMPPGSLEQVVFRMDALGRLADSGVVVVNPPRAIEVAVDKYLASAKLQAAGLPTPRTIVCQSAEDALAAYEELGRDVVVKPLFGSEGRGMVRVDDPSLARRVFKALAQIDAVVYLQEFVPHEGSDLRLLILGDRVFAMRRRNAHDWRTNVSRGAAAEPYSPPPLLVDMARTAASAVGALFAGVDILPAKTGDYFVLEINAVPGWKALAATTGIDVAAHLLDYLETLVSAQKSTSRGVESKL